MAKNLMSRIKSKALSQAESLSQKMKKEAKKPACFQLMESYQKLTRLQ